MWFSRIQILASCLKELIQRGIVLNDLSCNLDEEQLVQNLHREAVNIPSLAGMNLETLYKAISVGDRISSLFVDSNKLLQYLVDITEVRRYLSSVMRGLEKLISF